MAIDLEKGGKGSLKEIVSVVRTFAKFRPFTIQLEDGTRRSFDSLLFANIAEMAKYATLSETGPPNDGRFEVIALPHTAKWRILRVAFRSATRGLGPQPTVEHYAFTTLKPIPLQLDGELLALDPGTPGTYRHRSRRPGHPRLTGSGRRRRRSSRGSCVPRSSPMGRPLGGGSGGYRSLLKYRPGSLPARAPESSQRMNPSRSRRSSSSSRHSRIRTMVQRAGYEVTSSNAR
jgi:hypothetical protein